MRIGRSMFGGVALILKFWYLVSNYAIKVMWCYPHKIFFLLPHKHLKGLEKEYFMHTKYNTIPLKREWAYFYFFTELESTTPGLEHLTETCHGSVSGNGPKVINLHSRGIQIDCQRLFVNRWEVMPSTTSPQTATCYHVTEVHPCSVSQDALSQPVATT